MISRDEITAISKCCLRLQRGTLSMEVSFTGFQTLVWAVKTLRATPVLTRHRGFVLFIHFWHGLDLSESIAEKNSFLQETEAEQQRRKAPFYPAFSKLVALIQGKVRYPDNWEGLSDDEKKDFKHSRYEVSDTLLDAAGIKCAGILTKEPT